MHALAFRVMRLCRPDIPAEFPKGLGLRQDFLPDDLALESISGEEVRGSADFFSWQLRKGRAFPANHLKLYLLTGLDRTICTSSEH